jgi:rubredoxin
MNKQVCRVCGQKSVRQIPTLLCDNGYITAHWYCRHCGAEYVKELGEPSYDDSEIVEHEEAESV